MSVLTGGGQRKSFPADRNTKIAVDIARFRRYRLF